jgi:hypothetical protein
VSTYRRRGNRIGVGACRRFDKIDHSLRQEATVRFVSTATHIRRHADAFPPTPIRFPSSVGIVRVFYRTLPLRKGVVADYNL